MQKMPFYYVPCMIMPNKPEKDVIIPKRAVIKFKAGKEMRAGLNEINLEDE